MSNIQVQSSVRAQTTQTTEAPERSAGAKFKDFFVKIGQGLCKMGNAIKTFFDNIGQRISTRMAEMAEARATRRSQPRDNAGQIQELRGQLRGLLGDDLPARVLQAAKEGRGPETVLSTEDMQTAETTLARLRELDAEGVSKSGLDSLGNMAMLYVRLHTQPDGRLDDAALGDARTHLTHLLDLKLAGGVTKDSQGTILRANSAESAFLTALQKTTGEDYSAKMLTETRLECNSVEEIHTRDPKATPEQRLDSAKTVTGIYTKLIGKLTSSADQVPQEICDACRAVYEKVLASTHTDDREKVAMNAVAGVIILRLINPDLVNPNAVGHLPVLSGETPGECATLVSKLLQNQANGKGTFAAPELKVFEPVLKEWAPQMAEFLQAVVERGV